MENQEKVHKRRVRYSGTHPKNYKEKYKKYLFQKFFMQQTSLRTVNF